jgi:hypothetical protein
VKRRVEWVGGVKLRTGGFCWVEEEVEIHASLGDLQGQLEG